MGRFPACAEGTTSCSDVTAISALLPLFPFAVLLALVVAWPLAAIVPRRRQLGVMLAVVALIGYLAFSSTPTAWAVVSLIAVPVGSLGFAFAIGRRATSHVTDAWGRES